MHYCQYKYFVGFVMLNCTDKQSNLEMSSLLILPIITPFSMGNFYRPPHTTVAQLKLFIR